jgi:HK97 gp10 family phage protein
VSNGIKLEGMDQILERLGKLATPSKVRSVMSGAMVKAAKPIEQRIAALAPRGKTPKSVRLYQTVMTYKPAGSRSMEVRVLANSPFAHLVEFGTVKMRAQPFIRPGFAETQDTALSIFMDEVEKKLLKEGV